MLRHHVPIPSLLLFFALAEEGVVGETRAEVHGGSLEYHLTPAAEAVGTLVLVGGSTFGSIEDVAVAVDQQGAGIGRALINHLLARAQAANCYKTVLYCEDEVLPFYAKIGFRRTTNGMRYDHPTATTSASGTA